MARAADGEPGPGRGAAGPRLALFAATLFVASFLLFWLEPLFSKAVLPLLGGAPAVWNTALVFYQGALLVGYLYAHGLARRLPTAAGVGLHGALLLAALLVLPPTVPEGWSPPAEAIPIPWMLALLTVAIGLPFAALSATAPLVQAWWSRTGAPTAEDPYHLYAASNAGSLGALVAFPFVLEPALGLERQAQLWSLAFGAVAVLVLACGVVAWRSGGNPGGEAAPDAEADRPSPAHDDVVDAGRRLRWLALSFAPASLLHGVTSHLTTDVAAVPLLWVVPLALYLATFVVAFARRGAALRRWGRRLLPWIVLPLVPMFFLRDPATGPFHLLAFTVVALACHAELARRRPSAGRLTEYYLWVAAGGLAGGLLNGVAAPYLFDGVPEYPAMVAFACALVVPPGEDGLRWRAADLAVPAMLTVAAFGATTLVPRADAPEWLGVALIAPAAGVVFAGRRRPLRFGAGVGALLLFMALFTGPAGRTLLEERSYFGVVRVFETHGGELRELFHGTTLHGSQLTAESRDTVPLTYYGREGPVGSALPAARPILEGDATDRGAPGLRVGAVGLGTGSLACYRRPGDRWTFYEIDPVVVRVARDTSLFTYLAACAPGAEVELGDARLSLRRRSGPPFDVLVMDAFSSDAVPAHLLTREALELYGDRLAPDGLLLFHLSNRHLELVPIVARLAREGGWTIVTRTHTLDTAGVEGDHLRHLRSSRWAALTRSDTLSTVLREAGWRRPSLAGAAPLWTDRHTSVLEVLRW